MEHKCSKCGGMFERDCESDVDITCDKCLKKHGGLREAHFSVVDKNNRVHSSDRKLSEDLERISKLLLQGRFCGMVAIAERDEGGYNTLVTGSNLSAREGFKATSIMIANLQRTIDNLLKNASVKK